MFGLLKTHRLIYRERSNVGGDVWSFAFDPERPLNAKAGQHGILQIAATAMKPFSLASAPGEDAVLIGTSLASGSAFKKRLAALRPGDAVTLRGPVNNFTLDGAATQIVLLAQGVGITPLRAMLAHVALSGLGLDSSLIHVAHGGHAYRKDTERWATSHAYPQHAEDFRAAAAKTARARAAATFYVAGAPAFVSSTTALLRDSGIPASSIREDKYIFYKPRAYPPAVSDTMPLNAGQSSVQGTSVGALTR